MKLNKIDKYMILLFFLSIVTLIIGLIVCIAHDNVLYYFVIANTSFIILLMIPLIYIMDKVRMISNRLSMDRIKVDK